MPQHMHQDGEEKRPSAALSRIVGLVDGLGRIIVILIMVIDNGYIDILLYCQVIWY